MSLDAFLQSDTATLQVQAPNGGNLKLETGETDDDGEPIFGQLTIEVLRKDSAEAQQFISRTRDKRLKDAAARGTAGTLVGVSTESLQAEAIDLAVFCTRGWENMHIWGEVQPYSQDKARRVYSDPRLSWILDQVALFAGQPANYSGNE